MINIIAETRNGESYYVMSFAQGHIIALFAVVAAIAVAFYLLRSFGLYKLAKNQGIEHAFIVFIPCVWIYTAFRLIGNVRIFGTAADKFAVLACVLFSFATVLPLAYDFLSYFPYVGYVLQGGSVDFISGTDSYVRTGTDFINPFDTQAVITVLRIIYYFNHLFRIAEIFITVVLYINLFKKFLPERYILVAVLSFFGLFPIFAFAIRNNKAVDFNEYIRRRFYGSGYTPYGNGGNNGYNDGGRGASYGGGQNSGGEEPFGEFSDRPEEPFGEFSEGNGKDKKDDEDDYFNR